jgi:hypothetical protein
MDGRLFELALSFPLSDFLDGILNLQAPMVHTCSNWRGRPLRHRERESAEHRLSVQA